MTEETTKRHRHGVKCKVARDFWNDEGERVPAGTEVEIPLDKASVEKAMDDIASGLIARVK